MRILEVIESRVWINSKTGRTASIFGAVPYTSETEKQDWTIETRGYTWRCSNGTVGLGRRPVATRAEALKIMSQINERAAKQHAEYAKAFAKAMESQNETT